MLTCPQIEAGIAGVCVGRERKIGVESNDRHGQHNLRLCHTQVIHGYAPLDGFATTPTQRRRAGTGDGRKRLPHAVCVELARQAIAEGPASYERSAAVTRANEFAHSLLGPVINATGVLLHTNLGRAPIEIHQPNAHEPRVRPRHRRARLTAASRSARCWRCCAAPRRRWW